MKGKLTIMAAALAMLILASVPALAQIGKEPRPQRDPGDKPGVYEDSGSTNYILYDPSMGTYVDCSFSYFDPAKLRFCVENGTIPRDIVGFNDAGEIESTAAGSVQYANER